MNGRGSISIQLVCKVRQQAGLDHRLEFAIPCKRPLLLCSNNSGVGEKMELIHLVIYILNTFFGPGDLVGTGDMQKESDKIPSSTVFILG